MRGMPEILGSSLSREELEAEAAERGQLISVMVGQLYPSILLDEIVQIRSLISTLPR